jgi:hypothetical protein
MSYAGAKLARRAIRKIASPSRPKQRFKRGPPRIRGGPWVHAATATGSSAAGVFPLLLHHRCRIAEATEGLGIVNAVLLGHIPTQLVNPAPGALPGEVADRE